MSTGVGSNRKPSITVSIVVAFLVLLWTLPTLGLFVSSFRSGDQISLSGWWNAPFSIENSIIVRSPALQVPEPDADGLYRYNGQLAEDGPREVLTWGITSRAINAFTPGEETAFPSGERVSIDGEGMIVITSDQPIDWSRGKRLFATIKEPPSFTWSNYFKVLLDPANVEGMMDGLVGTASIAIPATVIPIMIAAFAAYALAWMQLPARQVWLGAIIALLVVPLQLSLIPVLQLFNMIGIGKSYVTVLLAHTGFGLPLAIFLLYNYIARLPGELIQSAQIDGATDFQIFTRIILPLSVPALASFAIFQFLWTWNDLLVARVFFTGSEGDNTVMTAELVELLGTRGGDWEILAASAFVSMFVPLIVFFALQRYLVRGLLAGSVKGG